MTRTPQRQELALDDLDAVVGGGGASPIMYFLPVATQSTGPAHPFSFGLPMAHDTGHAADGIAPSVPGQLGAPGAPATGGLHLVPGGTGDLAGQDAHPPGSGSGAGGAGDHGTHVAALPLSFLSVPGELGAPATPPPPATAAAPAPSDASTALFLGLPGGTDTTVDPTHGASLHNDWAPGSFHSDGW